MDEVRYVNGYRLVKQPDHPRAMSGNWEGYVYEHIIVAEKALGRFLNDDEEVHHLNQVRDDNQPENLLVLLKSQHTKLHAWLEAGGIGSESANVKRVNSEEPTARRCKNCELPLSKRQTSFCCNDCRDAFNAKNTRMPPAETLQQDLDDLSWVAIGRKYGVSDKAVRKWAEKLNLVKATPSQANGKPLEGVETTGEVPQGKSS
jgi:hypothetical protein